MEAFFGTRKRATLRKSERNLHEPGGEFDFVVHDNVLCASGRIASNHMEAIPIFTFRGVGLQPSCRVVHVGTQTKIRHRKSS